MSSGSRLRAARIERLHAKFLEAADKHRYLHHLAIDQASAYALALGSGTAPEYLNSQTPVEQVLLPLRELDKKSWQYYTFPWQLLYEEIGGDDPGRVPFTRVDIVSESWFGKYHTKNMLARYLSYPNEAHGLTTMPA
jgi:hypothetical protein